jgi:hypothetical protein
MQDVALSATNTTFPKATAPATSSPLADLSLASSQYLYGGTGSLSAPQLGDIRISYGALPSGTTVTAFGTLNHGTLTAYTSSNNHTLYALLAGDRQTAIATLHSQYETQVWLFRAVGIALIWIGLMMLLAPLDVLLDFIPIAGEIGTVVTVIITLPLAIVIGGTVILIGYTFHHVIALIIGVPLIFAVIIGLFKLIKRGRGLPKRGSEAVPAQPIASPLNPPPANNTSGSLFSPSSVPVVPPQPNLVQPVQPAQPVQPVQPIPPQPPVDEQ